MLRNYITIAFRTLTRKPLFSLINLFGLSAGLACVLVISGYILFSLSYDRQYENSEDLYRVTMKWIDDGVEQRAAMAVPPVADALNGALHSVKEAVRVYPRSGLVSRDGIEKIREERFCFADSGFFRLFNQQAQRGVLATALDAPFSVVLTERMAIKYFGTTDIVGQDIIFEDDRAANRFHVTAVIDNISQNSHLNPDFIASLRTLNRTMSWYNNWHYPPMYVYIQAAAGYQAQLLEQEVAAQVLKNHPSYIPAGERSYSLQRVTDIHLHSELANEWQANSRYVYIQVLIVVASLILFLACINYINLSTAQGAERAREVGVRKVIGAGRFQLVRQFLGESFVTTVLAAMVAAGLAELTFRLYLNGLLEKELSLFTMFTSTHFLWAVGGLIVLTLIAGVYPAFFLSNFRPVSVLKGNSGSDRGLAIRRSLVVFQFVVSFLLIACMLIIQRQTSFMREKHLGFDKELLLAVRISDQESSRRARVLKSLYASQSSVRSVSVASTFPMKGNFYGWPVTPEGRTADDQLTMKALSGDEDITRILNLELLAGRDFSTENAADSTQAFILNEAAAKSLNWQDPVGKDFELTFYGGGEFRRKGKVIGMVKDFHFESLYSRIEPLVVFVNRHPYYCDYMLVKLGPGNLAASVRALEEDWKKFNPNKPFEFSVADDDINGLYVQETKLSSMFTSFTFVSIAISCLGLFGLSAFSVGRRVKEISIRKVLGANLKDLYAILSREYVILILVAQAVAWPLAWWAGNEWLAGFAYKVPVTASVFVITLLSGVIFGLLSISLHIFRAALANPARMLRIE